MTGKGHRAFIIYDSEIDELPPTLEFIVDHPPKGFDKVVVAGIKGGRKIGPVGTHAVIPELDRATRVVAFVDLPNANVGFEAGYAMGLGKPVGFAAASGQVPAWLDGPPLGDYLIEPVLNAPELESFLNHSDWREPVEQPSKDPKATDTLFLCTSKDMGANYFELVSGRGWRSLDPSGWSASNLPEKLRGIKRVVWVITKYPGQEDQRDGKENSACAVVAGFAYAMDIELIALRYKKARKIADVAGIEHPFETNDEFISLLEKYAPDSDSTVTSKPLDIRRQYFEFLASRHSKLTPFFGAKSTSDVYVELRVDEKRDRLKRLELIEERETLAQTTLKDLLMRSVDSPARWAVLGEPGSGKSTVCRQICYQLAREFLIEDKKSPLPVFVHLAGFSRAKKHLFDFIDEEYVSATQGAKPGAVRDLLQAEGQDVGGIWLLFDGLDEVSHEHRDDLLRRVHSVLESSTNAHAIVTSRDAGFSEIDGFQEAKLLQLTESTRMELLNNWIGEERGQSLLSRLRPSLLQLSFNPLFLTLFAKLAIQHDYVPVSRSELFRATIKLLLEHGFAAEPQEVEDPFVATEILPGWSLELQKSPQEAWEKDDLNRLLRNSLSEQNRKEIDKTWGNPTKFIDDIGQRSGIIAPHDGPHAPWRFLHRSLHDYLVAEALKAQDSSQLESHIGGEENDLARWGESFGILCDLLGKGEAQDSVMTFLKAKNQKLLLRTLPNVENLEPKEALAILSSLDEWDGDNLLLLVRGWKCDGHSDEDVFDFLLPNIKKKVNTEELAYYFYALEESGVGFDQDKFFEVCKRPRSRCPELEFRNIPRGTARLGENTNELSVELDAFQMGAYCVTNEDYAKFENRDITKKLGRHPVVDVSWWDAYLFCRWMQANLPTEAQWEYACRAGSTTKYWSGDDESDLAKVGWYDKNSDGDTHPVGEKEPNPWGLFDVHGNVWEWCRDCYSRYELRVRRGDGMRQIDSGEFRVLRGGSGVHVAQYCRSAFRYGYRPSFRFDDFGFRPVRGHHHF